MTLLATTALTLSTYSLAQDEADRLSSEVTLTERAIRFAARRGRTYILYDAKLVGNPATAPSNSAALTSLQLAYRDALALARYIVTLDGGTGFWRIEWSASSAETIVTIYSIRTTVTPGGVSTSTINAVQNYIDTLLPPVRSRTVVFSGGAGGDILEADFGGTNSVFYEYTVVVTQTDNTDHSVGIKGALTGASLGYTNGNVNVYRMVTP